ncbi:hypothetical protein BROSI_A0325 [Candidatus Brocadia sinica JPN1]|uniref:Uncharacterized protein n=1 Tax=Candidatus Brocadia sinica JPN1 TaxID=1197129 RepID=A0ABQ0JSX1_9BACT|nr:hypothetical protein BROSI_A0325 [Candidatus Brocadia sinica JPN1]
MALPAPKIEKEEMIQTLIQEITEKVDDMGLKSTEPAIRR